MVKKLSKTGRTKFEIDNLDFGFIHTDFDHYKELVKEFDWPDNSIMTKGFVLDRIESFKVGV